MVLLWQQKTRLVDWAGKGCQRIEGTECEKNSLCTYGQNKNYHRNGTGKSDSELDANIFREGGRKIQGSVEVISNTVCHFHRQSGFSQGEKLKETSRKEADNRGDFASDEP
jgi:hypothetical protein